MTVRVLLLMLGIGPWCAMHGQDFSCSIAARCSLPLNDPPQRSYHLDLGYADTSWTIDWLRIDYAAAYLFKTIDDFTLDEQTRSGGLLVVGTCSKAIALKFVPVFNCGIQGPVVG